MKKNTFNAHLDVLRCMVEEEKDAAGALRKATELRHSLDLTEEQKSEFSAFTRFVIMPAIFKQASEKATTTGMAVHIVILPEEKQR